MIQSTESLSVWHWAGKSADYIVAARGVTAASAAFHRIPASRSQAPRQFPETKNNTVGHDLATAHPGKLYRRKRRATEAPQG